MQQVLQWRSHKQLTYMADYNQKPVVVRYILSFFTELLLYDLFILFVSRLQKFYRVLAQILIFHRHLRLNKPELRLAALLSKKHDYEGQAVVLREFLL